MRCATLLLAFALAGCQTLKNEQKPPAKPAFALEVQGPDEVRELLQQHMELQRFREFDGLRDMEINRLIGMAPDNIRELVATLGYFSPDIEIERENRNGQIPIVRVKVQPGPLTQVSAVDIRFTGNIADNPDPDVARQRDTIRGNWGLTEGKTFRQDDWSSAKTAAVRSLTARRYLAGRLTQSAADIDPETRRARLNVALDSGPIYRFGEFNVSGLERYDQVLMVERFARLQRGSEYSLQALLDAQQRMASSGFFDSVYLYVDPDSPPDNAPIEVQVREAKMQKVVLGVGLSTDSGPRFSAEHNYLRLPVLGWKATSKLAVDRTEQSASVDLLAPPDEDYWRSLVSAGLKRSEDADLTSVSQTLKVGRTQTSENYDRSYYLQYERASEKSALGDTLTSALSVNYAWTRRRFDNNTYPTRGWGLALEVGGGFTLTDKQYPFTRVLTRALGYVPISTRNGRIALGTQLGAVTAKAEAPVPSTLQFLTGGDSSVRGYSYRSLGLSLIHI